jgi:hypothetical protein
MALYQKSKFYVGSCGEPIIFELFDKFKDVPLIGLEYLVEIIQGPNVDPTYECLLCKTTLESKDVISCVVSARHRLKYLEKFYSTAHKKFDLEPNIEKWEQLTFDFLESVSRKIEEKHGRLSVTVVTKADYDKQLFASRIEDGPHFRQSSELDFVFLPNVFKVSPFLYIPPEAGELFTEYFFFSFEIKMTFPFVRKKKGFCLFHS